MRYLALMDDKPHLLVGVRNNLGAETRIHYAPSTRFYLSDQQDGRPWITRLPFPVHVVERVETFDHISGNRFVSRYAYHHGYFDGEEREFRGFGMVEEWDSTEFHAEDLNATNAGAAWKVPPVRTKTWFHTGAYDRHQAISHQLARDYFGAPQDEAEFQAWASKQLLDDTLLPDLALDADEEREAVRALKGMMLRQEVYADDAPPGSPPDSVERSRTPYSITEQNFTICCLQPRMGNRHAVFFTHPREVISFHTERNPDDPRIQHALTLEVDDYGNVRRALAIGYGRLGPSTDPALEERDREKQTRTLITYTESRFTHPIDETLKNEDGSIRYPDAYRAPLPAEIQTYELTGFEPKDGADRFTLAEWTEKDFDRLKSAAEIGYEQTADPAQEQQRLIEDVRTRYRTDDLTALSPLGQVESMALPGETYTLSLTPGLLDQVFRRKRANQPDEALLPNPGPVLDALLGGKGEDQGSYVKQDGNWWIPSGRIFFDPDGDIANPALTAAQGQAIARQHFFQPSKFADPFDQCTRVDYDGHDLLVVLTADALQNTVKAENDYRVLQPWLVIDPNRNHTAAAFDALGLVVVTAVMGKDGAQEGDLLEGLDNDPLHRFAPDQPLASLQAFVKDPHATAPALLGKASTRILYDLDRFQRSGQPPFAATLARETHYYPAQDNQIRIQIGFTYSDGFGREVQKKIQAEKGMAPQREADVLPDGGDIGPGKLIRDDKGKRVDKPAAPRWVGSGRTVYNNKGKPVLKYEPFFSSTHLYEPERDLTDTGVSPVLFYDPLERVIATLHPNHTYEKVVFDPWQQTTYDVSDTCARRNAETADPRTDPDIHGFVARYFEAMPADLAQPWQTWHAQRIGGALGPHEQAAAIQAEAHADTPTVAHFDTLGRPFLTVAHNRVVCPDHDLNGTEAHFATRIELDIEGNQRAVIDAKGRVVMRYDYDIAGPEQDDDSPANLHQSSMEAGERWVLKDVTGKPIRAWDNRGHNFTTTYDTLRRPVEQTVRGTIANGEAASDPRTLNRDILVDRIDYGEGIANAEALNLRTHIYRHFDSAGLATNARLDANGNPTEAYDFKGNLLRSTRRLVTDYKGIPDWSQPAEPQLDAEAFKGSTRHDALNRPIQSIAPRNSLGRGKFNVIQPVFNEANLLEQVNVWLEHATEPVALLNPSNQAPALVGVDNIDYDAKGQRLRIDYKNGASTFYSYDPLTFRLTQLLTKRKAADFPGDDPQPAIGGWPGKQVQNLRHTYDPAGNITHIQDDAQQTIYFRNKRVEPSNDYTYDALNRLIQATGREHLGQGGAPIPHAHNDAGRVGLLSSDAARRFAPNDGSAMGTYIERYVYDAVGNFLQMQHRGSDPVNAGWTRGYDYAEPSLIEDGNGGAPLKPSNRLTRTTLNPAGNAPQPETYLHDAHGNMLRMPHLGGGLPEPNMHWDYKNQLCQTDLGGGGAAYYVYDASGQRVRRVWEKAQGLTEERIYLGGFEIFRKHGGPIGINTVSLERETLHVIDDKQRFALVETRTLDTMVNDPAPRQLIRYQFGNHLGSSSLELDNQGQIISFEEYAPYGSSTYNAVRSQTETAKRYRYTGKERDEETNLYYFGARSYASWLGRWTSCDPVKKRSSSNLYLFVRANPATFQDPEGLEPHAPEGVRPSQQRDARNSPYPTSGSKQRDLEIDALAKWINSQRKPVRIGDIKKAAFFEAKSIGMLSNNISGFRNMHSIIEIGAAYLLLFSLKLNNEVFKFNEQEKQSLFKTDLRATMAILLYEFAISTGPEKRTFTEKNPITQAIMESPALPAALRHYFIENKNAKETPVQGLFGFSPGETKLSLSFAYHALAFSKIMQSDDWSALYFGGLHYRVSSSKEGGLIVTFIDEKTRNSYFSHIPPDVRRGEGKLLGSTYQAYSIAIPAHAMNILRQWFREPACK